MSATFCQVPPSCWKHGLSMFVLTYTTPSWKHFTVFKQETGFVSRREMFKHCCVIAVLGCSLGQRLYWEHWYQRELTAETPFSLCGKLMISVRILMCLAWLKLAVLPFNFIFFLSSSCSFVVCILPVVTWSHTWRSSQRMASDIKDFTWKEGRTF